MTGGAGSGGPHPALAQVCLLPHQDGAVAAAIVALQRAAYAVEAELLGTTRIPPLHETPAHVQALDLTFLGVVEDREPVAALGYRLVPPVVDIDRLVVYPRRFRSGLGRRLVTSLLIRIPHERVTVTTGAANRPARSLYEGLGFRHLGDDEVAPGLTVARYERLAGDRSPVSPDEAAVRG